MIAFLVAALAALQEKPEVPRIESVVPAARQPHADDPAVVFYDSFDAHDPAQWKYMEPSADQAGLTDREALGGRGKSLELFYPKGEQGRGNRKLVFGDSPAGRPLRRGERFETVYWRHYVKHPKGWTGGACDKMSRATILTSGRWQQAAILHVWSSGIPLTLDPATGVRGAEVVTTRYNDFPNLKWLGNAPKGTFPVHGLEEQGRWVCVEAMMKLNTPGKKDGEGRLWVDGRLDAERTGMDFRGSYTAHTINAIFLEAYWNKGSPVDQSRWYDDFVVSTKPIGPVTAEPRARLLRTAGECAAWEVEVASDPDGRSVAWRSAAVAGTEKQVQVEPGLPKGAYFGRIRQKNAAGAWSDWSPWHQPFLVP
jgi:hypothetical protein